MMNVIALAFLLSYFGAVVVLVPEPHLTRADHHGHVESPSGLFGSAKQSPQNVISDKEPYPSSMDQVKDTLHRGYDKTVEGMQSAKEGVKETVGGVYHQAKHGVQDKAEQAKQGVQDKAGQAKHDAYETAQQTKQGVQDKAEQAKHGVQEVAGKFASHIPSTENAKLGALETSEKIASYMPSKEEAASFIPGIETGKEVADALKQKVGETKDRIASYVQDSGTVSYGRDSMDSLRRKLEDAKQQVFSYMQGREKDAAYLSFVDIKKTLDEASSYMPSKEMAASYIPGKESVEGIKKGVQETAQGMQEKAQDAADNAAQGTVHGLQDTAHDVGEWEQEGAPSYMKPGEGAASVGGYKGKLGGIFHGLKERLTGAGENKRDVSGELERRVHELCGWFDDGAGHNKLDVAAATRESYAYLMKNALGSIEKAREVFERATSSEEIVGGGGEWREQYVYLADSAKGALEAAKEVFERAVQGSETASSQKVSCFGKASSMSMLQETAIHSLSATLHLLVRTIYLATFSAVYGLTLWMTFLSGHLLSRSLPRQQLGLVQSKLFPVYLRQLISCVALCAIVHAVLHPWPSADRSEHLQYSNFVLCIGLSLLSLLVVEPRTTKMMFEKLKFEKEEGRGQSGEEVNDAAVKARAESIDAKFKGLHQMGSCLNVAIVAGLTWHLWYLANRLII